MHLKHFPTTPQTSPETYCVKVFLWCVRVLMLIHPLCANPPIGNRTRYFIESQLVKSASHVAEVRARPSVTMCEHFCHY